MLKKAYQIVASALIATMALSLPISTIVNTGCTLQPDTVYIHDTTNVSSIFYCFLSGEEQHALLFSDPLPNLALSDVTIKWGANSRNLSGKETEGGVYFIFWDTLTLSPGVSYTVLLSSSVGGCQGTSVIPRSTYILEPLNYDTLTLGRNVRVSWAKAQNASFYHLRYAFDAYNSSGWWIGYEYVDTFVVDTIFIIRASFFNYPGAAYYEGEVEVLPISGPVIGPGATSNMQGFVKGFLYGVGEGDEISFYVGTPVKKSSSFKHSKPSKRDVFNAILKRLRLEVE